VCGPSSSMRSLANSNADFTNTLQSSYAQNFGEQQGILSSLNNALEPILQGGPNQQGFSAAENAALTGSAINSAAAANRNAQVVAGSSAGGNTGVTTGGQKQLESQIASTVGTGLASNENQINLANYATGRQNFFGAESALGGVAAEYNPNATAGQATGAGGQAFGEAQANEQASNQWAADLGGLAGAGLSGWATGGFKLPK
jgi:hypothetical protein